MEPIIKFRSTRISVKKKKMVQLWSGQAKLKLHRVEENRGQSHTFHWRIGGKVQDLLLMNMSDFESRWTSYWVTIDNTYDFFTFFILDSHFISTSSAQLTSATRPVLFLFPHLPLNPLPLRTSLSSLDNSTMCTTSGDYKSKGSLTNSEWATDGEMPSISISVWILFKNIPSIRSGRILAAHTQMLAYKAVVFFFIMQTKKKEKDPHVWDSLTHTHALTSRGMILYISKYAGAWIDWRIKKSKKCV